MGCVHWRITLFHKAILNNITTKLTFTLCFSHVSFPAAWRSFFDELSHLTKNTMFVYSIFVIPYILATPVSNNGHIRVLFLTFIYDRVVKRASDPTTECIYIPGSYPRMYIYPSYPLHPVQNSLTPHCLITYLLPILGSIA